MIYVIFAVAALLVVGLYYGWQFKKQAGRHHAELGRQLSEKYNLDRGKYFSLESSEGRRVWFSLPEYDTFFGVATYGSDSFKSPCYSSVAVELKVPGLYQHDFMILNQNAATRRCSFIPFKPIPESCELFAFNDCFHIVSKRGSESTSDTPPIYDRLLKLDGILADEVRFEIRHYGGSLTVFIGCHKIESLEDLCLQYQVAMACADAMS